MKAEAPRCTISNGLVDAVVYLPDSENGFYRGTRFDWSGVIGSLTCGGHSYFAPWKETHDPCKHDSIAGPVEEFHGAQEPDIDYPMVREGENFLRLGVGLLRKEEACPFQRFHTYAMSDPGEWLTSVGVDHVDFEHRATSSSGLSYRYEKAVRLAKDEPVLRLEHTLTNSGSRRIDTWQYNHNFLVIDDQPAGPAFEILLPFWFRSVTAPEPLCACGRRVSFDRELKADESVLAVFSGYGADPVNYDITVIQRVTGGAVQIQGDLPLVKLLFWAKRRVVCPEPYIDISVEPGQQLTWKISYRFFAV